MVDALEEAVQRYQAIVTRGGWQMDSGRMRPSLLKGDGRGGFTDVTAAAGLAQADYPSQASAWADYDLDGDLDLYIGNEQGNDNRPYPSQLFRNNGDGTFTDVAEAAGVKNDRMTKSVAWGGGYVDAVVVDPRGKFVVAGGTNGAVRFFGPDGVERGGGRAGTPVRAIAFSPTEPVVFVAGRREGSSPIYVAIEVPSGKQRWRSDMLPFSSSDAMAVSADGKLVAFADHEAIYFVEAATGRVTAKLPTKAAGAASELTFSPDRKTLYADDGRTVLAWDISFIR